MDGFHTDGKLFVKAEKDITTASESLTDIINEMIDIPVSALEEYEYTNRIKSVTDDIKLVLRELDNTNSTTKKLKKLLSELDITFAAVLSNDKIISIEEKSGGLKILNFEDYIVVKKYDSKTGTYKNVSIFDESNISSNQYGADQSDFLSKNFKKLISDEYIWNQMQKYYPEESFSSTDEAMDFYERYFSLINKTGCGYAAATNTVFKEYEGREEEFKNTFGYPMYKLYGQDYDLNVDFNYEYFMLDYFNYNFAGKYTLEQMEKGTKLKTYAEDIFNPNAKSTSAKLNNMDKFLKDIYGIDSKATMSILENYTVLETDKIINYTLNTQSNLNDYVVYAGGGYDLYEMDGDLFVAEGGGHYMSIVDYTKDGNPIVSSWGRKYILDAKGSKPLSGYHRTAKINF